MIKKLLQKIDNFLCRLGFHQKPKNEYKEENHIYGNCPLCSKKMEKLDEGRWF